MLISQNHFQLFADYFQFYIQDENSTSSLADRWDKKSCEINLAIASGIIGVGTLRNMTVPVTLEIHDIAPDDDYSGWDKVNECSIEVPSGSLVIAGCTDFFPTAARIQVKPQCYRARIYYGGLGSAPYEYGEGDDYYKLSLWPAPYSELKILK